MQILIAENAGFCSGVERAVKIARDTCRSSAQPIFSLGDLIHNPQVVEKFRREGLQTIKETAGLTEGKVVIRSHGVKPGIMDKLKKQGLEVIDATCPHVKKAQYWAKTLAEEGFYVVIVGERGHPEVEGLAGWAGDNYAIVENAKEAACLPFSEKIGLISQTTQREENIKQVEACLREKTNNLVVRSTVCRATRLRQQSAGELAKEVDLMLVIGGRNSANTGKLASICSQSGTLTYHIETAADLYPRWFNNIKRVGITAGASTPDWIIEEVVEKMMEFNENEIPKVEESETAETKIETKTELGQDEVEAQLAGNMQELRRGALVTGEVVQITEDEILVDVGAKSEAILPISELTAKKVDDPSSLVNVGDKIEVQVIKVENDEGHPVVSKKRVERRTAWEQLEKAFNEEIEMQAEVIEAVKGGLLVDVGINGFVPASLVERGYVENLEAYVGKTLRLRVLELDRSKNKVVLSQKAILDEEYEKRREETWNKLEEKQVIKGIVRRLTDFGAFVDIGGVDGLLHVSEISWGRVEHPRDVLSEGQEIEVKVLGIDREEGKVSLGRKQLLPNPWNTAAENYPVGTVLTGKVLRIAPFGAFVEVEPGVEGLVHISQLANHHVEKTEDVVNVGEEVPVKVLSVDTEAQRMSLSIKEARNEQNQQKAPKKAKKAPQEEESGVTLGDLFGDLFEENGNE